MWNVFLIYFSETAETFMHCSLNGPPENIQKVQDDPEQSLGFFHVHQKFENSHHCKKNLKWPNGKMLKAINIRKHKPDCIHTVTKWLLNNKLIIND